MSKKVFIDGGAHEGESVDLFYELYQDANEYEIHSFEPNPDKWEILAIKKTILHKEGLWDKTEMVDFFQGKYKDGSDTLPSGEGSTFLRDKVSGKVDYNNPIPTLCIRLSDWIKNTFNKEDYIILKLDVEGAEYRILKDLIRTRIIDWIDELLGEYHETGTDGRILSLPATARKEIETELLKVGKELKDWHNNIN